MFGWFNATQAKALGAAMADFVVQQYKADKKLTERKTANKVNHIEKRLSEQIAEFKTQTSLNFYTTAQLANTFKWKLKSTGFSDVLIDELTRFVLVRIRSA